MVWNSSLPADTSKIKLSANFIRQNWAAIEGVLGLSSLNSPAPYIPTTHPMWFYSNVVPTGWTLVAVPGDTLLAIKGGAIYTTGGVQTGTWSGPPHTLTLAQIPSHSHPITTQTGGGGSGNVSEDSGPFGLRNTQAVGGGGSHQHDWTATRPQANVGILCTKNP